VLRKPERDGVIAPSERWPGFIALPGINQPEARCGASSVAAAKVKTCFSTELSTPNQCHSVEEGGNATSRSYSD
jgi:hypothetical protein